MQQCGTFLLAPYFKEQNSELFLLMSFQYVRNYDTPCWLKPFLFILKILFILNDTSSVGCALKIHRKRSKQGENFLSSFLW